MSVIAPQAPLGPAGTNRVKRAASFRQMWQMALPEHSLRQQVAKSVSFQTLGSVATQGASFLSLLIVAHLLGKESYGRFALVQNTVNTFIGAAALGLGVTATKYVSQYRVAQPLRLGRILGLSSAAATLAASGFALAYFVTCPLLVGQDHVAAVRAGAVSIFFTTLNGYQLGGLAGFEAFATLARISVGNAVLTPPLTAVLTYYFGLGGAVLGLAITAFLQWCWCHFALRAECKRANCAVSFGGILREGRILLTMSAPASLASIIASVAIWIATVLLSKQPGGIGEVALFSAANSLRIMVLFLPLILLRVMLPRLNFISANAEHLRYRRVFWLFVLVTGLIAGGIGLVLGAGRDWLLALFGKGFRDPAGIVPILLISTVVEAISGSLSQALVVQGKMWRQAFVMGIWSLILVAALRFNIHAGARGLATANLVAWSAAFILYLVAIQEPNRLRPESGLERSVV